MKHVEFIGISGSGKSTFCRALKRRLAARAVHAEASAEPYDLRWVCSEAYARWSGIGRMRALKRWLRQPMTSWQRARQRRGRRVPDRFVAWQRFLQRHPEAAMHVAREFARCATEGPAIRTPATELLHLCAHYEAASAALARDDVLVLDEGFAHHQMVIAAFAEGEPDCARLAAALRAGPRPTALVWVQADPEQAEQRMAQRRGYPRTLRSLDRATRVSRLAAWDACIRTVVDELGPAVPVVSIANDAAPAQLADQLEPVLACLRQQAGAEAEASLGPGGSMDEGAPASLAAPTRSASA